MEGRQDTCLKLHPGGGKDMKTGPRERIQQDLGKCSELRAADWAQVQGWASVLVEFSARTEKGSIVLYRAPFV